MRLLARAGGLRAAGQRSPPGPSTAPPPDPSVAHAPLRRGPTPAPPYLHERRAHRDTIPL